MASYTNTSYTNKINASMSTQILLVILACVTYALGQTDNCSYDLSSGNDVIFLLDSSGSVSHETLDNVRKFMSSLIRNRMLIGPDPDYSRLSLLSFFKDTHYMHEDFNFIAHPTPVYESELLSPVGLLDRRVRKTQSPTDQDPAEIGFTEALLASRRLFVNNNVATRRKILFMVTDFHFDGKTDDNVRDLSRVLEVATTLRQSVTSLNGTLTAYGVGVGTYFNQSNMETILKAMNGVTNPCNARSITEWKSHIQKAGRLSVKAGATYGPRRPFQDYTLCCYLCGEQTNKTYANCSLEEFRSDFSVADVKLSENLVPLQCKSSGLASMCLVSDTSPLVPTTTTLPLDPEGPDETEKSSEEKEEEEGSSVNDMRFSALMVVFGIVNLVLVVLFIVVCIYAHRLDAPPNDKKAKHERQESERNIYDPPSPAAAIPRPDMPPPDPPRVLVPTRQAPTLPQTKPLRIQRSPQDGDSGIVNEAFADDQGDTIYGNQWVEDELQANDRRATQRVESRDLRRGHSGAALRPSVNRAAHWSEWSDSESSGYVRPTGVDEAPLETDLPDEDRDDYADIPDSAVQDLEEDRGDYVNVNVARGRMSYFEAVKMDASDKLSRLRNWSRNMGNRNSRGDENLNELTTFSNAGALGQNTLQTSVPAVANHPSGKPVQAKRPSLLKKLRNLHATNKDYVNQDVIQDLHDSHNQTGPGRQRNGAGPSQSSGIDSELKRKLDKARSKIVEEEEEAEETAGSDYVNDDALYRLRQQRGIES